MSDSTTNSPSGNAASPTESAQKLDPVAVLFALGSPVRWPIVKMLADGQALKATDVAAVLQRDFDGVSRQLHVLREAGVVDWREGEDRRQTLFFIPAARRPEPGVLDYGFCVLNLNKV